MHHPTRRLGGRPEEFTTTRRPLANGGRAPRHGAGIRPPERPYTSAIIGARLVSFVVLRRRHAVVTKRQNGCTSLLEPSTSENNFLSPNLLVEPAADARLCCARALAHRHVAPRRPRSELFTWQRLRCPKGSCIGKRGEGRWWVWSPANSRTHFSEGQKDYQTIGTDSLIPFEPLRGGALGGPKEPVPIIAVLELTSLGPLGPDANSSSLRLKRARRAALGPV